MKVAIHQPNYLPYPGFFQKMALADIFIILDIVQFSKDSYTQRIKIRTKEGFTWLTIPIEKKYSNSSINDVKLPNDLKWLKRHKMSIIANYSRCQFFDEKFIDEYYFFGNYKKLQGFNERGILYLKDKFNIKTPIVRANELDIKDNLKSNELLIELIKTIGGDVYISGIGGKNYIIEDKFKSNNIKLEYFESKPLEYSQRWEGFEPNMSSIDLLFNLGDKSVKYIHNDFILVEDIKYLS